MKIFTDLNASWWRLALLNGALFAVVMFGLRMLLDREDGPVPAAVAAGVQGVFFGIFMGLFQSRQNRAARDAVGDVPPGQLRTVRRATWRGDVPRDPEVRTAARRLAEFQLAQLNRMWAWQVAVFAFLASVGIVATVLTHPAFALTPLLFLGVLAAQLLWRSRLRRRVTLLT